MPAKNTGPANPREIHEIELSWVPMSDGTKLAARIILPCDADENPVPAVLEYIPYRRRDATRVGDDLTHPYFAQQGYASIRLDCRGTGDSEGVIPDEYLKQEQDDAVEAIAWIAAQRWCTGKVGMMGISWGGFNSLQVAARHPQALKAIITVDSTDDRYADDMHYMGGQVMTDSLVWGTSFMGRMARSPDPLMVGEENWRRMWRERLEVSTPITATWLRHQRRDEYWKHGSVCEDFSSIKAAVFAIGGWADGYSNAVFRMLAGLRGPRLGLIGPWGHRYPHVGMPGPAIGFLQEAVRWWDHWLKDMDTGIMNEPMLRAYVQDSIEPRTHYDFRPGHWAGERSWPSSRIAERTLWLSANRLSDEPAKGEAQTVRSPQTTGLHSGEWCPYGLGGFSPELPWDQREEDGRSLCFDSGPIDAPLEILGTVTVEIELSSDKPDALIAVRLNDVAPDGASTRVTYGILNLTHLSGHDRMEPLEPGKRYHVTLQLNEIGYTFAVGHRLRLAISTSYWPIVWPAPQSATLTVHSGESTMTLPVRSETKGDDAIRFEEPITAAPTRRTILRQGRSSRTVTQEVGTGETVYTIERDDGTATIDAIGVTTEHKNTIRYRIRPDDPNSARVDIHEHFLHAHEGWHTRVDVVTALSSTPEHFLIEADLRAFDGEERFFSRSWSERIGRDVTK